MVINLRRHRRTRADVTGLVWSVGMLRRDEKTMGRYLVRLNGADVTDRAFYVDSRRGIVRLFLHDAEGFPYEAESGDEAAWQERRGHVRLVRRREVVA